jgi:hypothetical protein
VTEEYSMGGDAPVYKPVPYGMSMKISRARYEELLSPEAPRKASRMKRFVGWASHRPVLLIAILGFVCGAALYALYQII